MKRRAFITLLGGIGLVPSGACAQQPMPVIGLLSSASSLDYAPMIAAFKKSLAETGFVEERNVRIEYVWADEHYDRLPALAADLVRRQVNVIVVSGQVRVNPLRCSRREPERPGGEQGRRESSNRPA